MNKKYAYFIIITLTLFLQNCGTVNNTYISPSITNQNLENLPIEKPIEVLYLLGDAGAPENLNLEQNFLFQHLKKALDNEKQESSIVFLGDNIYPAGLPSKKKGNRDKAEGIIDEQLDIVENFQGKTYIIPGNHDWNHWKSGGKKAIERQENYVQSYYKDEKNKVKFYPNNACGDPVVTKVSKDLYYLFIDSQWWLQDWEKEKKMNRGCDIKSRQEFLQKLDEIFRIYKNDQLVVFMHHPLYSNGEHGGKFSLKTHLFPLTEINKNLWIPIPLLGTIYPIHRSIGNSIQDISHPLYQELKNEILGMINLNKNIIFAAGHEHNFQYFNELDQHFIVSGSGSKSSFGKKGGKAEVVRSVKGYSKLFFYKNGEVWLDFIQVDSKKPKGELFFRKQIVEAKAGTEEIKFSYPFGDMLSDSISFAANKDLAAKKFKGLILGKQYRTTWTTPIKVPIIKFETEKGGIFPVKKGGGMASNSLRVENAKGHQYALRSIKKDYSKLLGPELAHLSAIKIMEDLNSAGQPYAPLTLPTLSKAAGIYYTKPKLVYLQKQNGLGNYNELFEEELYLLEDRPEGNREDFDHLGNSKEIISYIDLLALKLEDNSIIIDEEWTLRSRIFDIWIHDWDRHDDQWRWALIEKDGKKMYRPIPRDRDQTFYKFEGILPWLASATVIRKFKNFNADLKDVKYQSFNARYFDRYFLHELEWKDWEKEILFLQENLTDEVIAKAMKQLPPEVYDLSAPEIASKLKSRRDNLLKISEKLFKYIAKEVSVPGSNEDEQFEIKRKNNGNVEVKVFSLNKKGKKKDKIYSREFDKKTTKEIRLYGLGGKDEFILKGKTKKSILIRVIGGFGKDKIKDKSHVKGLSKLTKVYDEKNGIKIIPAKEIKDLTGPSIDENDYNREDHLYNKYNWIPDLGYTVDDKIWLGVNLNATIHGFRKTPYKANHKIGFSFSPSSKGTFRFNYEGDFNTILFNFFDLNIGLQLNNPIYINYFGLGNNISKSNKDLIYNSVRLRYYESHVFLQKGWRNNMILLYGGPKYQSWKIDNVTDRVLDNTTLTPNPEVFENIHYLGAEIGFKIDSRNNKVFPTSGIHFKLGGSIYRNLKSNNSFNSLNIESTLYYTFSGRFATTLASRTGWIRKGGDLNFYNYESLGGNNYLRGFRNDNFRGNHIFYQNIDIRMKLMKWNNKIIPLTIGILGGYDIGRVWLNNEKSNQFHHGFTGGVWFNILDLFVLQPNFSISKNEKLFNFKIGFNF